MVQVKLVDKFLTLGAKGVQRNHGIYTNGGRTQGRELLQGCLEWK